MNVSIRALAVLVCALALSACNDDKKAPDAPKVSVEQSEVLKYNAYVGVANSVQRSFGEDLERYESGVKARLDSNKEVKELYFSGTSNLERIQERLDKAVAMSPAMAELDGPAKEYSAALATLSPLMSDMNNYISAKTYLSDKGAHAREIQPAFIAAMQAAAAAQEAFHKGIDAKDRARTKAEFEKAEKGTTAYFRAGMIYYSKESMDLADGVFEGKGLGAQQDAFKKALDQVNDMAVSYDGKMREANKKGCSSLMLHVNSFLATGRSIIEYTSNGRYAEDAKRPPQFQLMQSQQERDANQLRQNFNNVVNALNIGTC